ncbi:hypothetical protein HYS54_00340 [Candidatus Micrarchaeota archaeon]|nr:hypothetical protein [Candidatus Micrarchaeota archaeon]
MGLGNWVIFGLGFVYLFSPRSSLVQSGLAFGQPQQLLTLVGAVLFLAGAYNIYKGMAGGGKH